MSEPTTRDTYHHLVIDTRCGEPTLGLRCTAPADADCRLRPSDEREVWSQDDDDLTSGHECWALEWVQCVGWEDAVSCDPEALFPLIPVCVYYDEGVHIEPRSVDDE